MRRKHSLKRTQRQVTGSGLFAIMRVQRFTVKMWFCEFVIANAERVQKRTVLRQVGGREVDVREEVKAIVSDVGRCKQLRTCTYL
jgi:hypothetical protein